MTVFEDTGTSVLLSLTVTDVDSIDGVEMVVCDTVFVGVVVVAAVADGDPHITLKFPLSPP